jgi:hypothetical protein
MKILKRISIPINQKNHVAIANFNQPIVESTQPTIKQTMKKYQELQ